MKSRAYRRSVKIRSRRGRDGEVASKRHSRALWLETLENRALLSGTPELLKNINPRTEGSSPGQFVQVGPTVFFSARDSEHGRELWKTDGTAAGTVIVKDIDPGDPGSYPEYLTAFKGALFFAAGDGEHGTELWKSDGTAAGT